MNADPTAVGSSFTIPTKGGTPVDWTAAVDGWVDHAKTLYSADSSFDVAELFNFEAFPGPADFLQAYTIGVAGTNSGASVAFAQMVYPFKGVGGGGCRPSFMEGVELVDQRVPYVAMDGTTKPIADFVLSADNWIALRGGGFPVVSLGFVTKTNDQLRKRYFSP